MYAGKDELILPQHTPTQFTNSRQPTYIPCAVRPEHITKSHIKDSLHHTQEFVMHIWQHLH